MMICKAYGVVTKGNGEAWVILEKHMTLAIVGTSRTRISVCAYNQQGW